MGTSSATDRTLDHPPHGTLKMPLGVSGGTAPPPGKDQAAMRPSTRRGVTRPGPVPDTLPVPWLRTPTPRAATSGPRGWHAGHSRIDGRAVLPAAAVRARVPGCSMTSTPVTGRADPGSGT